MLDYVSHIAYTGIEFGTGKGEKMKRTKTEMGYNLENETFRISVSYEYSFGKKRTEYCVENKETGKFYFPKTLGEAKELSTSL